MRVSAKYNISELLRVSQRCSLALVIRYLILKENSERGSRCAHWNLSALSAPPSAAGCSALPSQCLLDSRELGHVARDPEDGRLLLYVIIAAIIIL